MVDQKSIFTVIEHQKDLSNDMGSVMYNYFNAQMNVKKRQIIVMLKNNAVRLSPGEMQMMIGKITCETGVKGVGNLAGKMFKGAATVDVAIKPLYKGNGILITEPSYTHYLIEDMVDWPGGMVCDDGSFICCDDEIKDSVVRRSNFSSAVLCGEGLFNLCLQGPAGYCAVLKSRCPREELYEIILNDEEVKIDGNNAVAWSNSLQFTVEKTTKNFDWFCCI